MKPEPSTLGRDLNKFPVLEGANRVSIEEGLIAELVEILFEVCLVPVPWLCGSEEVTNLVIDGRPSSSLLKPLVVTNEFEPPIFPVFPGRKLCENRLV